MTKPKAAEPARAARQGIRLSARRSPEHKLTYALLLSLLIHTLLLHLTFGNHGWLPGFRFPWQDRRIAVPDLRVSLVPARSTPAEPAVIARTQPARQRRVEQPGSKAASPTPPVSDASVKEELTAKEAQTNPKEEAAPAAAAIPANHPVASPARAEPQSRHDTPGDSPPPTPAPDVIASLRKDEPTWVIPPPAEKPAPSVAATPSASSPQTVTPSTPDPGDAARIEAARLEAERVEAARVEAARVEAARVEAARVEAARLEARRLEA